MSRPLEFSSIFTDHMVLQQNQPLPVWGSAAPGDTLSVELARPEAEGILQVKNARADEQGGWTVTLDPLKADARPHTLTVRTESTSGAVVLKDILVGEVWLCSGQSNMQWPLSQADNAETAISAATHPAIRLFMFPPRPAGLPQRHMTNAAWQPCTPDTAISFSAVGYFFGCELHRQLGLPIGLINTSLGGTRIEAWTSREFLQVDPAGRAVLEAFDEDLLHLPERQAAWEAQTAEITEQTKDGANLGFSRGWAEDTVPEGEWKEMQLPGSWQSKGLNFSGVLWFRKTVDIPPAWAGQDIHLAIGATDKSDITYFNNVPVGSITMQDRPDAWCVPRIYTVPGKWVRPGHNTIAVRVHSDRCAGGMCGPATNMYVACPSRPDAPRLSLAGIWRYAVEANYGLVTMPVQPMSTDNPNAPSVLYNGMIEPLAPLAVRGAIWYQGESNAVEPRHYRTLLPGLIRSWRARWHQERFHFLTVQLPNYMARPPQPAPSTWAVLREAQAMTLTMPDTGMAVAIDLGLADDIHPPNKLDVGNRLAWNACDAIYGRATGLGWAPVMKHWRVEDGAVHITFDHTGGGLVCRGERVEGFALAGADRRFVWADTTINPDSHSVRVSAADCPAPLAIRYAWADNPPCTLYGQQGLPVAPFRTDDWETD